MYRTPAIVGRHCVLRPRPQHAARNTRGLLEKRSPVQIRGNGTRFSSTEGSTSSGGGGSSILKPLVGLLAVGGAVTVGASLDDSFREAVEGYVPGAETLLGLVVPRVATPVLEVADDLPSLLKKPKAVEEEEQVPVEAITEPEVGTKAEVEVVLEAESVAEEVVEEVVDVEEVVEEASVIAAEEEVSTEEVVVVEDESTAVAEAPVSSDVAEEAAVEEVVVVAEEVAEEAEEFVVIEVPEVPLEDIVISADQQEIERQTQILTTEYENIRIILDDTITTKSSAVRMLHGYVAQFSQALLVAQHDPAYASIWDAISAVGNSIRDSMVLVKTKEIEVSK